MAVYDVINYYPDHQEEIKAPIEENRSEWVVEKHGLKLGESGYA